MLTHRNSSSIYLGGLFYQDLKSQKAPATRKLARIKMKSLVSWYETPTEAKWSSVVFQHSWTSNHNWQVFKELFECIKFINQPCQPNQPIWQPTNSGKPTNFDKDSNHCTTTTNRNRYACKTPTTTAKPKALPVTIHAHLWNSVFARSGAPLATWKKFMLQEKMMIHLWQLKVDLEEICRNTSGKGFVLVMVLIRVRVIHKNLGWWYPLNSYAIRWSLLTSNRARTSDWTCSKFQTTDVNEKLQTSYDTIVLMNKTLRHYDI